MLGYNYDLPTRKTSRSSDSRYSCSAVTTHRLTKKQAKASGWMCTHCGAPLGVRESKVQELESLAKQLRYTVNKHCS